VLDRYWKKQIGQQTLRVFRIQGGVFEAWRNGMWVSSDYWERAVQDPEYVEIDKLEADELIKTVGITT
jgi:hypothetical protein